MSELALFATACLYGFVAVDQIRKGNTAAGMVFAGYAFSNLCFIATLR